MVTYLKLFKQPIVRALNQDLQGYELLARMWNGETFLMPGQGRWLSEVTPEQMAVAVGKVRAGVPDDYFLSVNVPDIGFLRALTANRILAGAGPVKYELLETHDWAPYVPELVELGRQVSLWLDDYGDGYEASELVSAGCVEGVKISLASYGSVQAAMSAMPRGVSCSVIERIETQEQLREVAGSDRNALVQGFYTGRPLL